MTAGDYVLISPSNVETWLAEMRRWERAFLVYDPGLADEVRARREYLAALAGVPA